MKIKKKMKIINSKDVVLNKELLKKFEYTDVLFAISDEVINYRKKYGLTQEQLAQKLHTTQVMISKIESGNYNFSVRKLVTLWFDLSDENFSMGEKILTSILNEIRKNYLAIYSDIHNDYNYTHNFIKCFEKKKYSYNTDNIAIMENKIIKVG